MRFGFYSKERMCIKSISFFLKQKSGFTLIELIVALAVISIAVTCLVQMFSMSINLSQVSQNTILASSIAKDKLFFLIQNPDKFLWKVPNDVSPGENFPILTSEDEPKTGNRVEEPKIAPPDWSSFRKYKNMNEKFRWKAYGKIPEVNANYYEVTVMLIYKEGGRTKYYTESSTIPRFQVDKLIRREGV